MNMEHTALFEKIQVKVSEVVNEEFIKSTKTEKGNTQISERVVIEKIRDVLKMLELTFQEAGSQQSKDFRNVGGIGLDIEIKKTDNPVIYFNDTCPSKDIYYIVLFTGKEYKRTPEKNIPAKLLFINGEEFIHDSPWIHEYIEELTILKDKYARGENKKNLAGIMEVYPRPTFRANISKFLCDNKPCEPETEIIKLCVNMDCVRYPPDWDFEGGDTEETYQVGQWQKCCLCDGYYNDDGLGDILFVQEDPNNEEAECDLCGKTEDIVQMKGSGQYLCGNACDEEEDDDEEEEEEEDEEREKELEIERISNGECPKISHELYLSRLTSEQRVAEKENGRLWEIRLKEINIQHEKELAEDEDGIGCNECYVCVSGGSGPCVKEKEKND